MMRSSLRNPAVLMLFIGLAILMTYPLPFNMGSCLRSLSEWSIADPLLNTWILSWNVHKISSGDFRNFFDANIFYPHKKTLAYSEILLPQSLVAWPVLAVSKNPILAYNLVLLFAFITSGLGMYFLARFHTKNTLAGIIAGTIYAFSPFMFDHLGHIQILTAGGIPLSFLFLYKFIETERYRDLLFLVLFYCLQSLANLYYALYLTLFLGLVIVFQTISKRKYRDARFLAKLGLFVLMAIIILGPFFYQYSKAYEDINYSRRIGTYATLTSFLATSSQNRLYGKLTLPFSAHEAKLFPGIVAFLLALLGIVYGLKQKKEKKTIWIYSGILVFAFLFALGPKGPYLFLHEYVPGFKALRAVARVHIIVIFSLAVFASFGIQALSKKFQGWKRWAVPSVLLVLILIEYLSIPLPLRSVPVKDEIPGVYKWLAAQKDKEMAVLELPLPPPKMRAGRWECYRIYYSAYHWKNLVNGYSGFSPLLYKELRHRWQNLSVARNVRGFKELGIRYIILHTSFFKSPQEISQRMSELTQLKNDLLFVRRFGEACVFELLYQPQVMIKILPSQGFEKIPKKGWKAGANAKNAFVAYAIDGKISTGWRIGSQRKGDYFKLDLGSIQKIRGLSLRLGKKVSDYPRNYSIQISRDGIRWKKVAQGREVLLPLRAYLKPRDVSLEVIFPPHEARHVKIAITRANKKNGWSIAELDVLK